MGWWNALETSETIVSDGVLDTVRQFLREFSTQFQNDLSRKPTVQELEYALNFAFEAYVDSTVVSGLDGLEIGGVIIKTSRRKKRQKAMPGDIFAYRLEDNCYGFGRIVAKVSIGAIAEIFDYFWSQPIFCHRAQFSWLIPPVPIAAYYLFMLDKTGDWRIIEHDPEFTPGTKYDSLRYQYGVAPHALMVTDIYENDWPVNALEVEGVPWFSPYDDVTFKELVLQKLAESGRKAM